MPRKGKGAKGGKIMGNVKPKRTGTSGGGRKGKPGTSNVKD